MDSATPGTSVQGTQYIPATTRDASSSSSSKSSLAALWHAQRCSHALFGVMATFAATMQYQDSLRTGYGAREVGAGRLAPTQRGPTSSQTRPTFFRRRITSETLLRCMYVTRAMAACLELPGEDFDLELPAASSPTGQQDFNNGVDGLRALRTPRESASSSLSRPSGAGRSSSQKCQVQWALTLRDSCGTVWPVTYETVLTCGQYHRRLSQGWRAFCRHHDLQTGDTVLFRRCPSGDSYAVAVRISRVGRA